MVTTRRWGRELKKNVEATPASPAARRENRARAAGGAAEEEATMAVCYMMEWSGVGQSEYDKVLAELGLDRQKGPTAQGGISHTAGPIEGGWQVVDVWESDEAFQTFLAERLGP